MKHICFFVGDISRAGGTERVTTVIASALAEREYDVSILSIGNGELSFFKLHPMVRLYSLHMEKRSANLSDWLIWWRLRRFLTNIEPDWIVDVDTILSWYSIPAAWHTNTNVISWEHFHLFINVGDLLQRTRRFLGRRLAAQMATTLITLTEKDRQQYLRTLACRVPVVAVPNPLTLVHSQRSVHSSKVVIASGRLVPQKGFDMLLVAWAKVMSLHTGWRLLIVGSGSDESALKAQSMRLGLIESVEFVPQTSDIGAEFQKASIYACSSRFEGLPLILIEAKSFGLTIVSFDCDCGPSDIVKDGVDGILVRDKDIEGLAQGLLMLMTDEPKRKAFGQAARCDDRFELAKIVDEWERLLA